ncbi:hypothetical protein RFI_23564 [Reticulomyxa filosa]|uniref:C2 domain-containing protein n=1 Tax=Reticulomyxa filosa TaxID=46433 RepID=X6MJH5_RETFI|nr:hypothetical protein RFI_23564 [Reticulomyxa filosa]|eukprot:ETO13806.1 hypothetical protein RFI_23564 [Reticulomyxa filosa]
MKIMLFEQIKIPLINLCETYYFNVLHTQNLKFKCVCVIKDLYVRIIYQGIIQDTKVLNGEKNTAAFDEPIILENAVPNTTEKLHLTIFDRDTATADDVLASAEVTLPGDYGQNQGETQIPLMRNGSQCGTITLDQVHFIKQKLIRYTGPCKCCCCCLG